MDTNDPSVQIIHRGEFKSSNDHDRRWLKRRQAIEPPIGHTKADHQMDRYWLQGAKGDAPHTLSCAAGHNFLWLMPAIVLLGPSELFCAFSAVGVCALGTLGTL